MEWAVTDDEKAVAAGCQEEMRSYAWEFWQEWLNKGVGPLQWGDLDSTLTGQYHNCMRTHFPELSLCVGDWKAMEIGKQYYSLWLLESGRKAALVSNKQCHGVSLELLTLIKVQDELITLKFKPNGEYIQ